MDKLPEALLPLNEFKQFIVYKLEPRQNNPFKNDKIPVHFDTGKYPVNSLNPKVWTSADTAIESAKRLGDAYGIGFVFTDKDPFWFLDIDDCLLPDNSGWSAPAIELIQYFNGCAVEVSSSGKGLHLFGRGNVPENHPCKNIELNLEFYTKSRFVALTGTHAQGSVNFDATKILPDFIDKYFKPVGNSELSHFSWTDAPCAEWSGP